MATIEYPIDKVLAFRKAWYYSDVEAMRRFAAEVPDLFDKLHAGKDWVVCDAAKESSAEVIQAVLDLGGDVNERDYAGDTPLCGAVTRERKDIAALLIERGADPSLNCAIFNVACQDLKDRVSMAKLLLDHGADINQPFLVEGLPPRNVLSEAIARSHTELVEFLKSRGAKLPQETADPKKAGRVQASAPDYTADIVAHFLSRYGKPDARVIREVIPTSNTPSVIHYIPVVSHGDTAGKSSVLFTSGLSLVDLPVPTGAEQYRRAELMLELDRNWPSPEKALEDPRWGWPVKWLRKIAAYAATSGNWLGAGFTTLVDEDPPQSLAPGLKFTAWLLCSLSTDRFVVHCQDGTVIQIYQIFPLYNEEYVYAREHGTEALMGLFVERDIQTYVDVNRPTVMLPCTLLSAGRAVNNGGICGGGVSGGG